MDVLAQRDIAAVGVRVLTEDGHAGAEYVLTGSQTLTQIDQVHTPGAAIGRPLRFEQVPPEQAGETPLLRRAALHTRRDPQRPRRHDDQTRTRHHHSRRHHRTPRPHLPPWATDHANDFR